ncbi:MAG: DUF1844 domain-containing protein [Verrucomicrobiota bacterium]
MAEIQKDAVGSREDTLRFLDMVSLFGSQAMMALGKLANPMTGKAEKNLDAARLFIDMLEMVEKKTRGNLTPDETKVLQASLADLRIMFVDESKAPAEPVKADVSAEASAKADDPKVKFHKSYGEA